MRRFALAAALANLAFANPVPEDPPSGIGTGVTIAIAPPGAVPSGCIANWDGQPFGIAAVNITGNRRDVAQPDTPQPTASAAYLSAGEEGAAAAAPSLETPNLPAATPAPVVGPGEGTGGEGAFTGGEGAGAGLGLEGAGTGSEGAGAGAGAVPEGAVGGEIVPADGPASREVPAAKLGVAMAPTDTDTTITVRSTRTHTRTVTVNKSSVTASSVEAPPAPPAPPAPSAPSVQITPTPAVQNTPSPTAQAPPPPPAQAPPPPPPSPAATQKPASGGSGSIDLSAYAVGCKKGDSLALTLKDGVLKDSANRIGYIASNRQFQFDGPPQAGAQVTAGFSICSNGTLALGPTTVFYQCRSGNFYNLYDQNVARQCNPVYLQALALKQC